MSIGIGITTRNRPECLEASLRHFREFGHGDKIVVVDDNSDVKEVNEAVIKSCGIDVVYLYSNTRLGISRAKNGCLANLTETEHVFIFDDDAWPSSYKWAEKWVETNQINGIGHSLYAVDCDAKPEVNKAMRAHIGVAARIGPEGHEMIAITNCFGVMLYFNRECLNAIGGYDTSAQNVYGYEHAQMSVRAANAGFTNGHQYISPVSSTELIYSIDIAHNWLGWQPPLSTNWLHRFSSSVTKEEADGHTKNAALMNIGQLHIPLINPFGEEQ